MANLFERLGQPSPVKTKIKQPHKDDPAQRLLDWLQRWSRPTVRARDICQYGPHANRKLECVVSSAEVLVKNGWLTPIKANRHDTHEWRIVRKPILHPTVLRETAE
jgi:hypothetical protein